MLKSNGKPPVDLYIGGRMVKKAYLGGKLVYGVETAQGDSIHLADSADAPIRKLTIYGKGVQNGTPTPDNPVEIENVGESGATTETVTGKNLQFIKNSNPPVPIRGVKYTFSSDGAIIGNGTPNASGGRTEFMTFIAPIQVKKGETYIVSTYGIFEGLTICISDAKTHVYLSNTKYTADSDRTIYVGFNAESGVDVNAHFYLQVERGASATAYEPYNGNTSKIALSEPLRAVPVDDAALATYTDASGQMWCADTVDVGGNGVRRIGRYVFNGTEKWAQYTGQSDVYYTDNSINKALSTPNRGIPSLNNYYNYSSDSLLTGKGFVQRFQNGKKRYYMVDSRFTTADDLRTFLATQYEAGTPVYVDYILAEPETFTLSAEETAKLKSLATHYPISNIYNSDGAWQEVEYQQG